MRRPLVITAAAAAGILVLGILGWSYFFPSEEARIRQRLEQLAEEVSKGSPDPVGGLARAARLSMFFTDDVVVEPGEGTEPIRGRDTLMAALANVQPRTGPMRVAVADVHVKLLSDTTADVTLTATVEKTAANGERSLDARELAVQMVRDGPWRIARVTAVDTLR